MFLSFWNGPFHGPDAGAVNVEIDEAYNEHGAAEGAGYYAQSGVVTAKCHSSPHLLGPISNEFDFKKVQAFYF